MGHCGARRFGGNPIRRKAYKSDKMRYQKEYNDALALLKALIEIPSFSGEEDGTADLIAHWLQARGIETQQMGYNVWAVNRYFDPQKPTLLLNSHHDTVRPNAGYTLPPHEPIVRDGRLYGLGSNDAGASLVSLMSVFVALYEAVDLSHNIILAATAEEENSGANGIRKLLPELPKIEVAIVGEPTEMQLAIAEKGLLVIDAYAEGVAGHAAHDNTVNAIYRALQDVAWIEQYDFPKVTPWLGKVRMSVTQIEAGTQHNVVPDRCHFVIDIRFNEAYTHKEVFNIINEHTQSNLVARSFKHNSSRIELTHPLVQAGLALGRTPYGSPTLSDQSALACPSLKIGPGVSLRSHTADEYIELSELAEGIDLYLNLLTRFLK